MRLAAYAGAWLLQRQHVHSVPHNLSFSSCWHAEPVTLMGPLWMHHQYMPCSAPQLVSVSWTLAGPQTSTAFEVASGSRQPRYLTRGDQRHVCREFHVQLQLLDSIAGTSATAAAFAQLWEQLQDLRRQLEAARRLADPAKRDALQHMVDQVSFLLQGLGSRGWGPGCRGSGRGLQGCGVHGCALSSRLTAGLWGRQLRLPVCCQHSCMVAELRVRQAERITSLCPAECMLRFDSNVQLSQVAGYVLNCSLHVIKT